MCPKSSEATRGGGRTFLDFSLIEDFQTDEICVLVLFLLLVDCLFLVVCCCFYGFEMWVELKLADFF